MRHLDLTPPRLAFIVMTRALLAAGVGLLVSEKLPKRTRRIVGTTLGAIGLATTIPALGIVLKSRREARRAREAIGSQRLERETEDPFTRRLVQLHT